MTVRQRLFGRTTGALMRPALLAVGRDRTSGEIVRAMTDLDTTEAVIVDEAGRVTGIVTERDVVRRVAFRAGADTPVAAIMTTSVETIRDDEPLVHALSRMRRGDIRHLPVVDRDGRLTGMIDLGDILAATAPNLMDLIDALPARGRGPGVISGLRQVKQTQIDLMEELLQDKVAVAQIQQLLTDINVDIFRHVIDHMLDAMDDDGWGRPAVAFEVLVMGSGGRGENFLMPDQDHGLILDDYPDEHHPEIDRYFIELAERASHCLQEVGFPLCLGHVMATNPVWRKSRRQWMDQLRGWTRRRHLAAARYVGIFLDFRAAWGSGEFTRALRTDATDLIRRSRGFIRMLYQHDAEFGTALGWFNTLITVKDNRDCRGAVNLKLNGIAPLVDTVRCLALIAGIDDTSTRSRIARLHADGVLSVNERDSLDTGLDHMTALLLRQQLADLRADRPVSSYLYPRSLSRRDYDLLIEALRGVERLRSRVRTELLGDAFLGP